MDPTDPAILLVMLKRRQARAAVPHTRYIEREYPNFLMNQAEETLYMPTNADTIYTAPIPASDRCTAWYCI